MWRPHQMQMALFFCAYSSFLAYFVIHDRSVSDGSLGDGMPAFSYILNSHVDMRATESAVSARPAVMQKAQQMDGWNSHGRDIAAPRSVESPTDSEDELHRQQLERLSEVSAQATTASDPQQRAVAIDMLGVATPEAMQALRIAATADVEPRNRIRAINMLSRVAGESDRQTALQILELARQDADPRVAARATAAHESLIAEQDAVADR